MFFLVGGKIGPVLWRMSDFGSITSEVCATRQIADWTLTSWSDSESNYEFVKVGFSSATA